MADTVSGLITSWSLALHDHSPSTRKLYGEIVRDLAKRLPGGDVLGASRNDLRGYFSDMRERGLAPATVRSRWIALRAFYGWLEAEGEIEANPMAGIKVARPNPPPPRIPTDETLTRLLKACSGKSLWDRRDAAMIRTAAATGLRVSELLGLEVGDVDLTN